MKTKIQRLHARLSEEFQKSKPQQELLKQALKNALTELLVIFRSRFLLGAIWVGIGVATYEQNVSTHLEDTLGPVLVGLTCLVESRRSRALYYIMGFAVATNRLLDYAVTSLWHLAFVWCLIAVYIVRRARV